MTNWLRVVRHALISGSSAGVASLIALAGGGHRDCGSAFAPVNAVSHWIWRDRALRQQAPSLRYTVPGYGIHHAMSIFWALLYEERMGRVPAARPLRAVGTGLAVSAAACFVDLKLTPERLTPGFERRLGTGSLSLVYLAFGLGLAVPHLVRTLRRRGPARGPGRTMPESRGGSAGPRMPTAAAAKHQRIGATDRRDDRIAAPAPHEDEECHPWNRSTTSPRS